MEKGFIQKIQKRIIGLLRKSNNKPLYISSSDNCSEVARLAGCWIIEKLPKAKVLILKGKGVLNTKKSHDIIAAGIHDKFDLIDPTIWHRYTERMLVTKAAKEIAKAIKKTNPFEWLYQLAEHKTGKKIKR